MNSLEAEVTQERAMTAFFAEMQKLNATALEVVQAFQAAYFAQHAHYCLRKGIDAQRAKASVIAVVEEGYGSMYELAVKSSRPLKREDCKRDTA